ncbi:MAG: hypothetical protein WBQ18_15355 [Solirubrobacteraceae bacterium]
MRLPRDWVGPLEDLLPIGGPPARVAETPDDLPPSADAFWSEDSAALHDAVRGPGQRTGADVHPVKLTRTTGAAPPHRITDRLSRLVPWRGIPRAPARWAKAVAAVSVVALLAMAMIGYAQPGATAGRARGRTPARFADRAATPVAGTQREDAALAKTRPQSTGTRSHERPHRSTRERTHAHRAGDGHRPKVAAPAPSGTGGTPSARSSTGSTDTTPASSGSPSSGTSAAGASGSGASTGTGAATVEGHPVSTPPPSPPAFGSDGTLGPGSSPQS